MSSNEAKRARVALHVPEHVRDNYAAVVRDQATASGRTVADAQAAQVADWRRQHDADPTGGYDHLADWLEDANLEEFAELDPAEVAHLRAVQSAKADHNYAIDGFDDATKAAIVAHRAAVKAANSIPAPAVQVVDEPAPADEKSAKGKPSTPSA